MSIQSYSFMDLKTWAKATDAVEDRKETDESIQVVNSGSEGIEADGNKMNLWDDWE